MSVWRNLATLDSLRLQFVYRADDIAPLRRLYIRCHLRRSRLAGSATGASAAFPLYLFTLGRALARLCFARHCSKRRWKLSFVTLRDGEDGEGLLKRFQTSMQRSGILRELRNRRFFRSKGEQTRLDKARSLRRLRRRARTRTR